MRTPFMGTGFPRSLSIKLRWFDEIKMSTSITDNQPTSFQKDGGTVWGVALNDIFDPRKNSALGGQPAYHDTLETIYSQYQVTKCNVSFRINHESPYTKRIFMYLTNSTSPPALLTNEQMEYHPDAIKYDIKQEATPHGDIKYINFTVDVKKWLREFNKDIDQAEFWTNTGNSPAYHLVLWPVFTQFNPLGSTSSPEMWITCKITYYVRYKDIELESNDT